MAKRETLTDKQQKIYDFIKDKILNRGYAPTVREIGLAFGITSPNGVMGHLRSLERKEFITREEHMSRAITLTSQAQLKRTSLVLAGHVAAGSPALAEQIEERADFADLFKDEEHFCLKVRGDSMIDDHIADGDFAVIRKQPTARDGDVVVALVEGSDATLKRFFKEKNRIRLEPANSRLKPIFSNRVEILGVLIGLIRRV